jgi:hypothetical protein
VPRLPMPIRRDPYWEVDGAGARRQRTKQRLVRYVAWLLIVAVFAVAASNLPSIDPEYLIRGEGRPFLAGAMLGLLGAAALLALARIRRTTEG